MQVLLTAIEQYGLWLVFFNVLALQLGLPVPAYPTLIAVGAVTARGDMSAALVIAVAVLASLLADLAWYVAGSRVGRRVLRLMCRLSLSPDSCVRQTESIYERWGAPSLMVAKFVPGFAAMATAMAGVMRTRPSHFVLFDSIGAVLWSGAAVALGWLFRDAVDDVLAVFERSGRWGLVALAIAFVLYLAIKAIQRHRLLRTLRMARVGVDDLHALMAAGRHPLILDVRSRSARRSGRIPGAVEIDIASLDERLTASAVQERLSDEVIVYCACPNEASAAVVAKRLMRAGFKHVRPLAGGIEAWTDRGYPLEASIE